MATHGPPPAGLECMVTFEEITAEEKNLCEYMTVPSGRWQAAKMSCEIVETMRASQFEQYMERVRKSTCEAEMRRLMAAGPPVYIEDKFGLPLPEGDTHVETLWYANDEKERSGRLEGAPIGEEREALWESLRAFQGGDEGDGAEGDGAEDGAQGEGGEGEGEGGEGEGEGEQAGGADAGADGQDG